MLGVLGGSDCGTCWAFATSAQIEAQLALTKRDGVLRRVDLGEVISCTSREERMKRNKFNGVPISAVAAKDLPVERLCTDGNIQTWVYAYTTQNGVRWLWLSFHQGVLVPKPMFRHRWSCSSCRCLAVSPKEAILAINYFKVAFLRAGAVAACVRCVGVLVVVLRRGRWDTPRDGV